MTQHLKKMPLKCSEIPQKGTTLFPPVLTPLQLPWPADFPRGPSLSAHAEVKSANMSGTVTSICFDKCLCCGTQTVNAKFDGGGLSLSNGYGCMHI